MIDLRSDTVTRPTVAMLAAMTSAPLGDDVFGDDPTVNRLQAVLAERLGFEAGLFMPTGTMSNLCGIMAHCGRGDEYIVGQQAHAYRWEGGGAAVMGSVQPQPLDNAPDGSLPLDAIRAAVKPDDPHYARSRLLALENTIGGKVLPMPYLRDATALAREMGLAAHLDGARLFNAAVAMGGDPWARARAIAGAFDSVSVCFSKGLGTPAGSMLLGPRDLVGRALRVRKMAGGGMRQAGILAAAALHALDHHVARLADDHARAARLAAAFDGVEGVTLDPVHSNIVFANLGPGARTDGFLDHLRAHGVLALGLYRLRFVTHLDVDDAGVDRAAAAVRAWFG